MFGERPSFPPCVNLRAGKTWSPTTVHATRLLSPERNGKKTTQLLRRDTHMTNMSQVNLSVKCGFFHCCHLKALPLTPPHTLRKIRGERASPAVCEERRISADEHVFVCTVCWPVLKHWFVLMQRRKKKHRTELSWFVSRLLSTFNTKFKCSFCFWDEAQHLREHPAGHPTLSCPCRTWHPPPICGDWATVTAASEARARRQRSALF